MKHLESLDFETAPKDHQNLLPIKEKFGIKPEYRSCHTAVSKEGYIFEGHIPGKYISQFLAENNPNAIGLSVPGMPMGSPGMEVGDKFTPYDVLILYKDGTSKTIKVLCRIDTQNEVEYYKNGGILQYVLRNMLN